MSFVAVQGGPGGDERNPLVCYGTCSGAKEMLKELGKREVPKINGSAAGKRPVYDIDHTFIDRFL